MNNILILRDLLVLTISNYILVIFGEFVFHYTGLIIIISQFLFELFAFTSAMFAGYLFVEWSFIKPLITLFKLSRDKDNKDNEGVK